MWDLEVERWTMKSNDCTDEIFDMYHVCPTCGESSGLYYDIQYPTFRKIGLDGKPFEIKNGKRTKKITMHRKAFIYNCDMHGEFQFAVCVCEKCGWKSEPLSTIG